VTEGSPNLIQKLRELLPANRVAVLVGVLLAVAAFVADLNTSLVPGSPGAEAIGKALIAIAAIVKALRLFEKFMEGSQNWDSLLVSGAPKNASVVTVNNGDDTADPHADDEATPEQLDEQVQSWADMAHQSTGTTPQGEVVGEDVRGMPLGWEEGKQG
jgi:hypothetical protein